MTVHPKVSIVIPCFNAGRFLRKTLESVFAQTFQDFEVVAVDDGSTDDTREILKSYGPSINAQFGPNRGASFARNAGTAASTGDFIQYLDADDLLVPDALERRLAAMRDLEIDVAYSDWQRLVEEGNGEFKLGEIVARTMESIHPDPELATFTLFWCPPAAILYRRRIVERIGQWHEGLPVIQDARFLQDAALHRGKFIHVPGVGAYYRVHRTPSLSRRSSAAFNADCFKNALEIEQHWRRLEKFGEDQKQAVLDVIGYVARSSFESNKPLFERCFVELNRLQPGWFPREPKSMAVVGRIFGYRNAEFIAALYRRAKRFGRPA